MIKEYGLDWDEAAFSSPLMRELWCYKHAHPPEKNGLGQAGHFRKIAQILWGPNNKKQFIWHPWADRMNDVVHLPGHVGISACASAGKTEYLAIFAIINWLCDPVHTLVLCTSTDLKAARKRVWGSVVDYFTSLPGLPGKLIDSRGMIVTVLDQGRISDRAGIALVACARSKEREAVEKIIGAHNKRVIMCADELPDISPAILGAAFSNLAINPYFKLVASGNFKSRYDSFGEFVKPKDGWDSINIESDFWETQRGVCIRFDGIKSPNIVDGKDEWPIYNSAMLARHKKDLGEHTALFWRMCRSFEAPINLENTLYSAADFSTGRADKPFLWLSTPHRISGMDPSFSAGGDRVIQWIGEYGQTTEGLWVMNAVKMIEIREDVRKRVPRDRQVIEAFIQNCKNEGVPPEYAALDVTGAGSVMYTWITQEWSPQVLRVCFSGAPSDLQVIANDPRTGKQMYDRRVSELWGCGRQFLLYGQIKGVTEELMRELQARQYDSVKGPEGIKIKIEEKVDMKTRVSFSPDVADAWAIMLELCRVRFGFLAGGVDSGHNKEDKSWDEQQDDAAAVYTNATYEPQEIAYAENTLPRFGAW